MENGKLILDTFQKHLHQNFETYCQRHEQIINTENFIIYLIDRELFSAAIIRRYTIVQEFESLYAQHDFHKSKTVATLADRFQLSERHIWSLLKYSQQPEQRKKYGKE